jgi:hypothetical protein
MGGVLLVIFIAHAGWRIRQGLAAAANVLAWSAALLFWWFGLMWTRWLLIDAAPFRYQWVSAGYVLLAVLPAGRVTAPSWAAPSTRRGTIVGTAAVALVAAFLVLSVRPDAQTFARTHAAIGRNTRGQVAVALEPRATVADGVRFGFNVGSLTARQVRELARRYGTADNPGGTDRLLVDTRAVSLSGGSPGAAPQGCEVLRRTIRAAPDSRVELYARTGAPEIEVRRFGTNWVSIGRVKQGRPATVALPGYGSDEVWELSATPGACVSVIPA